MKTKKTMDKNILVVSAHGADWCTRAGGTLLKYLEGGSSVKVFALTFGERGESGDYWKDNPNGTIEECKAIRKKEAQRAAAFMGIDIEFFDYNDYPLVLDAKRIMNLTHRILEIRPDIILTHWTNDPFNIDHELTGKAVIRAVSSASMLGALPNTPIHFVPDIFLFESSLPQPEFNAFEINTYVDISDVFDKKLQAIEFFKAQPHLVGYYDRCGTRRGEQANDWARGRRQITYAEGFYRYVPYVGDALPTTEL